MWVNVGGGTKINCAQGLHAESYTEEQNVPNARGAQNAVTLTATTAHLWFLHHCTAQDGGIKDKQWTPARHQTLLLFHNKSRRTRRETTTKWVRLVIGSSDAASSLHFLACAFILRWWKKKRQISQLSSPADVGYQPHSHDDYTVFLTLSFLFTLSHSEVKYVNQVVGVFLAFFFFSTTIHF